MTTVASTSPSPPSSTLSTSPPPVHLQQHGQSQGQAPVPSLLRMSPQTFQFTASKTSGLVSKLKIKNLMQVHVGYKFKTNAPLQYSVKPVLGVLEPGQSIEVYVHCKGWVNPQDRFLLQSVALNEHESQQADAASWKELDRRRIIESFIQCTCSSTLSIRDYQDDHGSLSSSSSSTSSSIRSDLLASEKTRQQLAYIQRTSQASNVAHVHAAGRKLSVSSTASNTSSPGSYPTLFSKGGPYPPPGRLSTLSSNEKNPALSSSTSTSSSSSSSKISSAFVVPAGYVATKLSNSKQTIKTLTRFLAVRQYTKMQVFTVSVICLLLGLLLPLEKIFLLTGSHPSNPLSSATAEPSMASPFLGSLVSHQRHSAFTAAPPSQPPSEVIPDLIATLSAKKISIVSTDYPHPQPPTQESDILDGQTLETEAIDPESLV